MSFAPNAEAGLRLVFLRGLEMQARLGVHPHEKAAPQRVVVHVELAVDDDSAPDGVGEDDLRRVVDYGKVVRAARATAAEGHTLLVETLAERIAVAALQDSRVRCARVTVEKPDAYADVAAVGVTIERRRR
ncbi:dihydroneopterin aldolase [Siccirubricoccus sp. KC 17139]|uniref:7,8-dihydroneopterin aldolase n=1 Tax=Siccirubricoccus soli TaxID=2899147 RepID=A0ABT1D8R2_9PROT|nr:dihydroneopterin aldolase [Siccirubricoccus soli]MCO6418326.1 dihydroneopterin aldolase [Siccirubricoccus soli]MCP2684461.1 dihydroneopterin aldolase [Siccirubricoccus soli]